MKVYSTNINLIFTNREEEIPGILKICENHIYNKKEENRFALKIMPKIKWVITELLTNSVKHCGINECKLNINISETEVVIEKEDVGRPLKLENSATGKIITWPLPDLTEKFNFQIYHNGMDSLKVQIDDDNHATFYVEQLEDVKMPGLLIDTSEHFGLLIITKASDQFKYIYDKELNTNRFISNFYMEDI